MKHIPPGALMRADSQRGSVLPFREQLLEALPTLRRYAHTLGGADHADDLLQETLARALKYEAVYQTQGAMSAWLRQILKNIAHDQHKSRQRCKLFCELDPDTTDEHSDSDTEDFASTVSDPTTFGEREKQLDAKNLIELAAKIIGAEMWECLERTAKGFTSDEIATELGISAAAVRQNVSRGRKAMEALRADPKHKVSKSIRKKSR
ncbi:RNA polymerase sigma factor [Bradyrhizobium sp. PUT101]|uniref:RNA polymerase sigma factor n=1 Tax=Bradyrhizobium sp. PUT101 TaxID=3447427 RepID=UPI003F850019